MLVLVVLRAGSASAQAPQDPASGACTTLSPIAAPCVGASKLTDALGAECRRLGFPDSACALPFGHAVTTAARDEYVRSWTHRAVAFQSALGDRVPLVEAGFLGTHNSFNSVNNAAQTVSQVDSNQQLSLTEQLDVDVRSLELDLHVIGGQVVVCHGRGPGEANAGCTNERRFDEVLPEVATWLRGHPDQVLLLYLEDELDSDPGLARTVDVLDRTLRRTDGTPMILAPDPAALGAKGCATVPLDRTRNAIRAAGAQVVVVGNCRRGWGSRVFEWDSAHVEGGSTAAYRPFPLCDATYPRPVYTSKLVRYFEDSTFVATAVDPTTPADDPGRLTPEKVAAMTTCGVTLFGFDQLLPGDGRLAATLWSWADGEPRLPAGCARQRADGRWTAASCAERHRVACARRRVWSLSTRAVAYKDAVKACRAKRTGPYFGVPRTANSNAQLRQAAGDQPVWIRYRVGRSSPPAP